ncbi:hypothetical protein HYPSUDRAFT_49655 [Hypholoma sublateritium FD-334 SS-4]|uniref:CsbD-like domain-containing protein n=1 Tax=Hypholoma sublateritium (strain FD-334 SS-4) TaxID=945553 RepID=A0A0D2KGT8_HYPSF|nr:hypothetical protein HYPSUDRAFT_49655 [Hypholoma sublateritium FD-334 SS-4]
MPLFGSKNNNDNITTANTTAGGGRHHMQPTTDTTQGFPGSGPGATGGYPTSHTGPGLGLDKNNNNGSTKTFAPDPYTQQPGGAPFNDDSTYATGAGGAMGGVHQGGGHGVPPTSVVSHDAAGPGSMGTGGTGSGGGGAGQRLTGKAERTIGNLVGSSALQAKGAQKEREAGATKLQGRELAEAERLENEALMRRERAVGHGAHPANSALGAGNTAQGGVGSGVPGGYN